MDRRAGRNSAGQAQACLVDYRHPEPA
jgi:hypothetical protein